MDIVRIIKHAAAMPNFGRLGKAETDEPGLYCTAVHRIAFLQQVTKSTGNLMSGPNAAGAALLSMFDQVFVINLASRTDRKREVEHQLNRLGLGFDHPNVTLFRASRPEDRGEFQTIGARGCYESHLGVIRAALAGDGERFLVLEDDMDLAPDFETRLPGLAENAQLQGWDVFYGYSSGASGSPVAEFAPDKAIECTHFIGFSRAVAQQAEPYLAAIYSRPDGDPRGGAMHVDGAWSWFRRDHPEFRTIGISPALAEQRPSRTDVHDLNWYDRIPLLQPVLNALRRLKRQIG
jgi:hypothetical protein